MRWGGGRELLAGGGGIMLPKRDSYGKNSVISLEGNHHDFTALHSMWRIFDVKGKCVLVRVEIIHMSKFEPGTVEKNRTGVGSIPAGGSYS